jgi:hypothetical protein
MFQWLGYQLDNGEIGISFVLNLPPASVYPLIYLLSAEPSIQSVRRLSFVEEIGRGLNLTI